MLNASSVMRSSLEMSAAGQTKCFSLIKSPIVPENTGLREKVEFWQSEKNVLIYPVTSLPLIEYFTVFYRLKFSQISQRVMVWLSRHDEYSGNKWPCMFSISRMNRVYKQVWITLLEPSATSQMIPLRATQRLNPWKNLNSIPRGLAHTVLVSE